MLIEEGWKPGVWIDGVRSANAVSGDVFGGFAHLVHGDLLVAHNHRTDRCEHRDHDQRVHHQTFMGRRASRVAAAHPVRRTRRLAGCDRPRPGRRRGFRQHGKAWS